MFLAEVGKALSEEEGGDVELADILTEHLLTTTPAKDAVAQAKNAISKLAGTRAASKAETDHG